jgi:hypothetical protein
MNSYLIPVKKYNNHKKNMKIKWGVEKRQIEMKGEVEKREKRTRGDGGEVGGEEGQEISLKEPQ